MNEHTADEFYLAARDLYFFNHGNPDPAPEVKAAKIGMSDLLARAQGREFTRDEQRLFRKYCTITDAADQAMVIEYRLRLAQKAASLTKELDTMT